MAHTKKHQPEDDSRVNHPPHYQTTDRDDNPLEAITVIEAFVPEDVHLGHALTYLLRAGRKVETEDADVTAAYIRDLKKARWWITRAIEFYDPNER